MVPQLCLNKAVSSKNNTFKGVSSPWISRLSEDPTPFPKPFPFRSSEYSRIVQFGRTTEGKNERDLLIVFHLCLLGIRVSQRTLGVASTGSSFTVVETTAERAKVDPCLVNE